MNGIRFALAALLFGAFSVLVSSQSVSAAQLTGNHIRHSDDTPEACLRFSRKVDNSNVGVFPEFIDLTPEPAGIVYLVRKGKLCISGLPWGEDVGIVLHEGLPLNDTDELEETRELSVTIGDAPRMVSMDGGGYILARNADANLPLVTRNVEAVEIDVLRVNERNLIDWLRRPDRLGGNVHGYGRDRIAAETGELVWNGTIEIDGKRNRTVRTGLPLAKMIDYTTPGVHLVVAKDPERDYASYAKLPSQWVVVSDMGLNTFVSEAGLDVFVSSHANADPIANAKVELIARNNRVLATAVSDEGGHVHFGPGLVRGEGGARPTGITAYIEGRDFTFLSLAGPAQDLSDRGVDGRIPPGPVDAFLYSDRGIYRPGETTHLSMIVRDMGGDAISGLPLKLHILRPDGKLHAELEPDIRETGMASLDIHLPKSAPTGSWLANVHIDPDARPIGQLRFSVEDFVPDRLAMELSVDRAVAQAREQLTVSGTGRFLFGAPAADLDVEGELLVERDPEPFPDFEMYRFGLLSEEFSTKRRRVNSVKSAEDGTFTLEARLPRTGDTTIPLQARVRATILEPGGRGLTRDVAVPIRDDDKSYIGLSSRAETVPSNGRAIFDVVVLDSEGVLQPGRQVAWSLYRERRTYHWERVNGDWTVTSSFVGNPVAHGQVTSGDVPVQIAHDVSWGYYRLDVYDGDAVAEGRSPAASSLRVRAGWRGDAGPGAPPDKVAVSLDKAAYRPGDEMRVHIDAPYAGKALVTVLNDGIKATRRLDVPEGGSDFSMTVDGDWARVGAYVAVTLLKPSEPDAAPRRGIGISWLAMDTSRRRIAVDIDAPEKIRPGQRIDLPIRLEGLDPGEKANLTLAAVDQGILSLTGYETPDPAEHFLGKRILSTDLRDTYGRLIDPSYGRVGRIRSGGDAIGRRTKGLGVDAYKSVALFSGILTVDADGRAIVPLDIPDFNGELRLMAVVATRTKSGSGEARMTVRAPVVAELSRPRFLAPGDRALMSLDLLNIEAGSGEVSVDFAASGAVSISDRHHRRRIETGGRDQILIPLVADAVGDGRWTMTVNAPDGYTMSKSFEISVRPAQPLETVRRVVSLDGVGASNEAGEDAIQDGHRFTADRRLIAGYVPGSEDVSVVLGATTGFDLPMLIRSLHRYPYGCLEQTISSTMPLLYLSELEEYAHLDSDPDKLREAVDYGIDRLSTMQRPDGAFGYWSASGRAQRWLTVYAFDFLTRARAAGFTVSDAMYDGAMNWIVDEVVRRGSESGNIRITAARAYAHYALAKAGKPELALFRYGYKKTEGRSISALETQLLRTTAYLTGVSLEEDFSRGTAQSVRERDWNAHDYGSTIRDAAKHLVLLAEAGGSDDAILRLADEIDGLMRQRRYLSTQEKVWLTLAGKEMIDRYGSLDVTLDGTRIQQHKPTSKPLSVDELARGVLIENNAVQPTLATFYISATPERALPPKSDGYEISRGIHTLYGRRLSAGTPLRQGERYVVVITGKSTDRVAQKTLVADLLPAGLEIENTRLAHRGSLRDFSWLKDLNEDTHLEFRDDRFVAAFDLERRDRDFRLAYIVRAVTPGEFAWPAPLVEDMYRPYRFSRGSAGTLKVIDR